MKNNFISLLWVTVLAVAVGLACAACGGGDGGSDLVVPEEVQAVLDQTLDEAVTLPVREASGSMSGLREKLETKFPDVAKLIAGGDDTGKALLAELSGTPEWKDDMRLAIIAYAIEARGDKAALPGLRKFLGDNVNGDLYITPNFVAHAILALEGTLNPDMDLGWYTGDQMLALAGGATDIPIPLKADNVPNRKSCTKKYVFADGNGQPIYFTNEAGNQEKAIVSGTIFASSEVTPLASEGAKEKVKNGGGTYVNDDPEFPGSPNKQFNCAGYVTRHFNGGKKWVGDPAVILRSMSKAGLMEEVAEGDAKPEDLVFYYFSSGICGHVAEVKRLDGLVFKDIIVRNADGQSGLWEAKINAPYFTGVDGAEATYPTRKIFRWKNGVKPTVIPDPDAPTDPSSCDYVKPPDENNGCTENCGFDHEGKIYLGTTPYGELNPLSVGLFAIFPADGQYTLISPRAIDGIAVSPDGTMLAAGYLGGTGQYLGDPQLIIFDVTSNGFAVLRSIFKLTDEDDPPEQLTNPAWLMDGKTLVVNNVGFLRLYDYELDKGSDKIWTGDRSTCSPTDNRVLIEGSGGLVGLVDAQKGAYTDYDPWDIPAHFQLIDSVDEALIFSVSGTTSDWTRPKWSPVDDRFLFVNAKDKTLHVATLSGGGASVGGDQTLVSGKPVGAAAWSPDGDKVAYAVTAKEADSGGIWVLTLSTSKHDWVLKTSLNDLWLIDLAWGK